MHFDFDWFLAQHYCRNMIFGRFLFGTEKNDLFSFIIPSITLFYNRANIIRFIKIAINNNDVNVDVIWRNVCHSDADTWQSEAKTESDLSQASTPAKRQNAPFRQIRTRLIICNVNHWIKRPETRKTLADRLKQSRYNSKAMV